MYVQVIDRDVIHVLLIPNDGRRNRTTDHRVRRENRGGPCVEANQMLRRILEKHSSVGADRRGELAIAMHLLARDGVLVNFNPLIRIAVVFVDTEVG